MPKTFIINNCCWNNNIEKKDLNVVIEFNRIGELHLYLKLISVFSHPYLTPACVYVALNQMEHLLTHTRTKRRSLPAPLDKRWLGAPQSGQQTVNGRDKQEPPRCHKWVCFHLTVSARDLSGVRARARCVCAGVRPYQASCPLSVAAVTCIWKASTIKAISWCRNSKMNPVIES